MFFDILLIILFGQQQYNVDQYALKQITKEVFKQDSASLDLISVQKYRDMSENDIYSDVLSHSEQEPYGNKHGRYSNVHETAHGIHSELRKKYRLLYNKPINVIYCLNGKCAIIENPNIKIRHVSKYIPEILRSSRYKLYLIDQLSYWDDTPTYLLDEWNCYVLGAECAVDDFERNIGLEKTNAVSGALEFSIYSVALAIAVKEHDTFFWENNIQFKSFIKYNLIRSEKVFNAGAGIPEFSNKEQDRLQKALLNHDDAEPIRQFLKDEFDGIFID